MNDFLTSNLAHFWWALSAFVVFVLIFIKLGVKHVLAAVDAREAKIARELKESEDAYAKAKQLKEDLDKQMKGAEHKISEMIGEARRDAETLKARMLDAGRVELDAMRTRALREIEAARHTAVLSLKQSIADISVQVAEKVIREKLDSAKHEQLVSNAVNAYELSRGAK